MDSKEVSKDFTEYKDRSGSELLSCDKNLLIPSSAATLLVAAAGIAIIALIQFMPKRSSEIRQLKQYLDSVVTAEDTQTLNGAELAFKSYMMNRGRSTDFSIGIRGFEQEGISLVQCGLKFVGLSERPGGCVVTTTPEVEVRAVFFYDEPCKDQKTAALVAERLGSSAN